MLNFPSSIQIRSGNTELPIHVNYIDYEVRVNDLGHVLDLPPKSLPGQDWKRLLRLNERLQGPLIKKRGEHITSSSAKDECYRHNCPHIAEAIIAWEKERLDKIPSCEHEASELHKRFVSERDQCKHNSY